MTALRQISVVCDWAGNVHKQTITKLHKAADVSVMCVCVCACVFQLYCCIQLSHTVWLNAIILLCSPILWVTSSNSWWWEWLVSALVSGALAGKSQSLESLGRWSLASPGGVSTYLWWWWGRRQLDHSRLCWPQWLSRASPDGLGFLTTWLLPDSCTAYMMAPYPEPSTWANEAELCGLWGPSLSGHTHQLLLSFLGFQKSLRLDSEESLILNGEDEPPPFDANLSTYFRMCLSHHSVCSFFVI